MKKFLLGMLIAVLVPSAAFAGPKETKVPAGSITGKAVWSGKVLVLGGVRVEPGASLEVKPGTVVRFSKGGGLEVVGMFKAEGRKGAPVTFTSAEPKPAPGDWAGINFVDARPGTGLKGCTVEYAASVTVGSCSPGIRDCIIKNGQQGIVLARKSAPALSGNRISDMLEDGILCQMGSAPVITGNKVERCAASGISTSQESQPVINGNTVTGCKTGISLSRSVPPVERNLLKDDEVGISAISSDNSLVIRYNVFQKCRTGISCTQNGSPLIENNVITGSSEMGISCFRFASPAITHNEIAGNATGISCIQLCNPKVYANDIHDNKTAIFLDLSAYAQVNGNNIYENKVQFELGNMSSDWENKVNKKPLRGVQAQNITLVTRGRMPNKRTDDGSGIMAFVDATGNWWGQKGTDEMGKKGPDANIGTFVDYFDTPTRTYEGYTGIYVQDRIKYEGWKDAKIKNAGVKDKGKGASAWSDSGW